MTKRRDTYLTAADPIRHLAQAILVVLAAEVAKLPQATQVAIDRLEVALSDAEESLENGSPAWITNLVDSARDFMDALEDEDSEAAQEFSAMGRLRSLAETIALNEATA